MFADSVMSMLMERTRRNRPENSVGSLAKISSLTLVFTLDISEGSSYPMSVSVLLFAHCIRGRLVGHDGSRLRRCIQAKGSCYALAICIFSRLKLPTHPTAVNSPMKVKHYMKNRPFPMRPISRS